MSQQQGPGPGRRRLLLVAGSGRSGTSLFTGLTGRLGVYIPKPEVAANRSNPRGFGEPRWAVDFHNQLLKSAFVTVDDGRPAAWEATDEVAERDHVRERLTPWLTEQFEHSDRVVIKDPRLAWFFELYRQVAESIDAQVSIATMVRHPAEVLKSRQMAYGERTENTTRVAGWLNMMLSLEHRSRPFPRAHVRYDDLLSDWHGTLAWADRSLGMDLLESADGEQLAQAGELVDPTLRRSVTDWSEMAVAPRLEDLAERAFATLCRLTDPATADDAAVLSDLDALREEYLVTYQEAEAISRFSVTAARAQLRRRQQNRAERSTAAEPATGPADGKVRSSLKRVSGIFGGVRG